MEYKDYLATLNKRKRPHAQEETKIQMELVNWLQTNHPAVLFTSTLGGIKTTIGQAVKLKRLGYRKGFPDLLIFEPRSQWHGLFIELKTTSGVVSIFQKDILSQLVKRYYMAQTCRGYIEAQDLIIRYLSLK